VLAIGCALMGAPASGCGVRARRVVAGSGRRDLCVVVEDAGPASGAADALVDFGGTGAVPADVAVLGFDSGLAVGPGSVMSFSYIRESSVALIQSVKRLGTRECSP
jgi:hypothetical protein